MTSNLTVPEVIMFKTISTLTVVFGLCLGAAPTVEAHDRAYDHYPPQRYDHVRIYRDMHMPHWLREKRGFRHWYHRTSLRHDYHLTWGQLFEVYRWERSHRHGHHRYDKRKHWKRKWRHHDDRRRHSKRKWRHHDDD